VFIQQGELSSERLSWVNPRWGTRQSNVKEHTMAMELV